MWKRNLIVALLLIVILSVIACGIYQIPYVNQRLSWRVDFAATYLRGIIHPAGKMPTPLPPPAVAITSHPQPTATKTAKKIIPALTVTITRLVSTPTMVSLPQAMKLNAPQWERQDINNCGPAALTMYLRYYGWTGNQLEIANILKPQRHDRNVNIDELAYYVRNYTGWLNAEYRVGGDILLLKKFIAAGIPVMIEETFYFESPYWPNDDLWAAHYNLLTGYDDSEQFFISQDSYYGSNQQVSYQRLDEYWQSFNRVYLLVYPPDKESTVISILGKEWDVDTNRQHALEKSMQETQTDSNNAFSWFNLGSGLVWFERYDEAAKAFDQARQIGLPQRMLRYQFGPFFAYFHAGRNEDLLALTKYALQRTPTSEEALLWHGWALYRNGKINEAVIEFQKALAENPNYLDAKRALQFVGQ